jgi:hypothetical protein
MLSFPWRIASLVSFGSRRRHVSLAPTFPPLARGSQHPYMLTGLLHLYRPRLHFVTAPSLPKLSTRPRRSIRSQLALPDGARRRFTSSRSSQRRFTSPSYSPQCLAGGSPPTMFVETKSGPVREIVVLQLRARRPAPRPGGSVATRCHRCAIPGRGWLQAASGNGFSASSRRRAQ